MVEKCPLVLGAMGAHALQRLAKVGSALHRGEWRLRAPHVRLHPTGVKSHAAQFRVVELRAAHPMLRAALLIRYKADPPDCVWARLPMTLLITANTPPASCSMGAICGRAMAAPITLVCMSWSKVSRVGGVVVSARSMTPAT